MDRTEIAYLTVAILNMGGLLYFLYAFKFPI